MRCGKSTIFAVFITFLLIEGCSGKKDAGSSFVQQAKVDVYFFHTGYSCEACEAIKSETKKNLASLFGEEVYFEVLNLEKEGRGKARALGVKYPALLVVKGDVMINLTNDGYLYARIDPEKFRQVLEENIKPLLKEWKE